MTDFLTSLAARTLTRPALQPRVLSRFEPSQRGEPVLPAEQTEVTRVTAPPAPRARRSNTNAPREARQSQAIADEAPGPPASSPAATQASRLRRPEEERRDAAPAAGRTPAGRTDVRETTKVVEVPVVRRERELIPAPVETIVETRTETRELRVPAERPLERTDTREVRVPAERPVERRETRSRYEEAPPVIADPRDEPLPQRFREERAVTSTTTRRTRELRSAVVAEAAAAPAPPEVHVSIGRVEVRATTAPAADKRRRDQPRVMTIDDYVAHRARKERP